MIENLSAMRETQVWSLGLEDPLEKGMATHFGILAWRIPRTEGPDGLKSMGSQRVRHDWVYNSFFEEGNSNLLQYSCLENSMDIGAWKATVHGVAKSQTQLRDFTFTFYRDWKNMLVEQTIESRSSYISKWYGLHRRSEKKRWMDFIVYDARATHFPYGKKL